MLLNIILQYMFNLKYALTNGNHDLEHLFVVNLDETILSPKTFRKAD